MNKFKDGEGEQMMLRLKAERLKRSWSQQDLGFYARISVADISRIERGWMKPYPRHAARLAQVLGLKPEELLEEIVPMPETTNTHA